MREKLNQIPTVKFEDLPKVLFDGRPITRGLVEAKPTILRAIQNVYGINVDMTQPTDSDKSLLPR